MRLHEPGPVEGPVSPLLLTSIRTIAALAVLFVPLILALPPFRPLTRLWLRLFGDLVPYRSLVPAEPAKQEQLRKEQSYRVRTWRIVLLVALGLVQLCWWIFLSAAELIKAIEGPGTVTDVLLTVGMVPVWLYLATLPIIRPPSTPPWPAFTAYATLWIMSLVNLCVVFYIRAGQGVLPFWATREFMITEAVNLGITSILLLIIGGLRLAPPAALARMSAVGPDDEVTLDSWLTFSWMTSYIALGNERELQPEDLPTMSPTQQTAIVFDRFRQIATSTLLRKILLANKLDLLLDLELTLVSVLFNYAGPFFLKRILDGLTDGSQEAMARAYLYALGAFLASALKAVSDLLHLWHSRRAAVRVKAELIAAIYDKALRRKDASGVVNQEDKPADAAGGKDAKKGKPKEEKKSNADTGKVVNLMSGDTNRIANTISGAYYIYGSPFEIVVASIFLYQILGWSAFAGIVVLFIAVPLNSLLSKRAVAITQDLMKARDKRIGVMSELIPAIQFIKFFAWTKKWENRAMEARKAEMKQVVRSLINGMGWSTLWNLAPIGVTLVSFFCFIAIEKKDLTVSVAFTAISLFTMLRMPLNIIPTFIVIILQAHVSVKRVEDFLNEEEVPDWVSSLKRSEHITKGPAKIAFENASFRWNSGKQADATATKPNKASASEAAVVPPSDTVAAEAAETYFRLDNMSVTFPAGKLTVITGPTGSGKTAMLTALLGEMELLEGKSSLPKFVTQVDERGLRNSVAYAAQTPWLQQKSIKDNILFGERYDEERYERTIEACALLPDFEMLEDGDSTEIGQKGISLSGGQKARVALARAVYSYTQHVLLDDPLAAVDSHTAKHLTDQCLNGPIMKGRTIILVSHHLELLLPSADYVVRILDGRIDTQGTPSALRSNGELDGLIALEEAEAHKEEPVTADEKVDGEVQAAEDGDAAEASESKKKEKKPAKKFVQDEERPVGAVKWKTYKLYIVAATAITWVFSILMLVFMQLLNVQERYWLKIWGEGGSPTQGNAADGSAYATTVRAAFSFVRPDSAFSAQEAFHADLHSHIVHHSVLPNATATYAAAEPLPSLPSAEDHPGFYLTVYAIIVLTSAIFAIISNGVGAWGQYRAAVNLHNKLLGTVMKGTIRFFNITPTGRIINRFSRDVETIDGSLSSSLRTVVAYGASLIGAVVVVGVIVPWFLLPAAIISWLYYRYSVKYLRIGRSLRRLESTSRSPIYSGFSELLDGVISVRAFSVEKRFMEQLCAQVDQSHSAFYYYWMTNRWLLLRFDILGAISVLFTTLFALSGAIKAGSAGMAILSSQSFVTACYWVSRFWGQLEMDFNAVERVQEYLEIPQEPPAVIENSRPPAYWPSSDKNEAFLSAQDLEIKYAPDLPSVFRGSFDIRAGEKIGLIGRTGSGKSTLAMSLLRFADPASGRILLDGIDITKIGVDDLRSRITYIPQDAVLFSGTVRDNLDPFSEHTDEELLDALGRVNLGPNAPSVDPSRAPSRVPSSKRLSALKGDEDVAEGSDSGSNGAGATGAATSGKMVITLTTEVSAGGSNFSQGQRQLVAMARALLRRSNLIIMDEATASVDFATDEALQSAIRSEFKSSTLLTIAHRLSSVIDYDRLLVLSDGRVVEFDTPINLLRKDDSIFKGLCEKSGRYKELYRAAERKEVSHTGTDAA